MNRNMPRHYKSDPHGKIYKKTDKETFEKARKDIFVNGLSYRQVSKKYNISTTVLHRHMKKGASVKPHGGQTVLTKQEEEMIVDRLLKCSEWGYPLDQYDVRALVKNYLDKCGKTVKKFKNNFPGRDFALGFLQRHAKQLSSRLCQNIKQSRASVSPAIINAYFDNLEKELEGVPLTNIVNYDESNLSDDPGRTKVLVKRGCKYPDRVLNHSKSSTSIMFSASANGSLLPCYVVYKSVHLYKTWMEGGRKEVRYNRTKSGWFDADCFDDWIKTVALPYFRKLEGPKVLIGDNLSSHLSFESIRLCSAENIKFIFLPSNSTHLTQPLDVAFFAPLKRGWRTILLNWKKGPGRSETTVRKDVFPRLLSQLLNAIEDNAKEIIQSGFRKCGIAPINRSEVLKQLPQDDNGAEAGSIAALDHSILDFFKKMRYGNADGTSTPTRTANKRKRLNVEAGRSVALENEDSSTPEDSSDEPDSPEGVGTASSSDNSNVENEKNEEQDRNTEVNVPLSAEDINIGDWVMVSFPYVKGSASSSKSFDPVYIGKVIKVSGTLLTGEFLRGRSTREKNGFVYGYPDVPDVSEFDFCQVKGKLDSPQKYGRGLLLFPVNWRNI